MSVGTLVDLAALSPATPKRLDVALGSGCEGVKHRSGNGVVTVGRRAGCQHVNHSRGQLHGQINRTGIRQSFWIRRVMANGNRHVGGKKLAW